MEKTMGKILLNLSNTEQIDIPLWKDPTEVNIQLLLIIEKLFWIDLNQKMNLPVYQYLILCDSQHFIDYKVNEENMQWLLWEEPTFLHDLILKQQWWHLLKMTKKKLRIGLSAISM